jgi:hypothetical protein
MYTIDPGNPLPNQFNAFSQQIAALAANLTNSVAAFGAPGIGKSHTAAQVLTGMGYTERQSGSDLIPGRKYFEIYAIPKSVIQFAEKLWEYRNNKCVLVLDDGGDDFIASTNAQKATLAKAILAQGKRTVIMDAAMVKRKHEENPAENMPTRFDLKDMGILWISNLHPDAVKHLPAGVRQSVNAVMNRIEKTVFSTDPTHIIDYSLDLAYNTDMLRSVRAGTKVIQPTLVAFNEATRFYVENAAMWKTPGCRTLENLIRTRHLYPDHWQTNAKSDMLAAPREGVVVKPWVEKVVVRATAPTPRKPASKPAERCQDEVVAGLRATLTAALASRDKAIAEAERARAESELMRKRMRILLQRAFGDESDIDAEPLHQKLFVHLSNDNEGERANAVAMLVKTLTKGGKTLSDYKIVAAK